MDPITHSLITRLLISSNPLIIGIGSIIPDIPFYATYPFVLLKNKEQNGDLPKAPEWVYFLHHLFHSISIVILVFLIMGYFFRRWPYRALFAWLLHILVDIPTHSREQWGPKFLWPFSHFAFDGISWGEYFLKNVKSVFKMHRSPKCK